MSLPPSCSRVLLLPAPLALSPVYPPFSFFPTPSSPLTSIRDYRSISSTFSPKNLLKTCLAAALISQQPKVQGCLEEYEEHQAKLLNLLNQGLIKEDEYATLLSNFSPNCTKLNLDASALLREISLQAFRGVCLTTLQRTIETLSLTILPPSFSSLSPRFIKDPEASSRRKYERGVSGIALLTQMVSTLAYCQPISYISQVIISVSFDLGGDLYQELTSARKRSGAEMAQRQRMYGVKFLVTVTDAVRSRLFAFVGATLAGGLGAMLWPGRGVTLGTIAGDLLGNTLGSNK